MVSVDVKPNVSFFSMLLFTSRVSLYVLSLKPGDGDLSVNLLLLIISGIPADNPAPWNNARFHSPKMKRKTQETVHYFALDSYITRRTKKQQHEFSLGRRRGRHS